MKNKIFLVILSVFFNLGFSQTLDKIFKNKSLEKEVKIFLEYAKTTTNQPMYDALGEENIETKKQYPLILKIKGVYEFDNPRIDKIELSRYVYNNNYLDELRFENGKVKFNIDERYQFIFKNVIHRAIVQVEPDVYLLLYDLKDLVDYQYVDAYNKDKIWKREDLTKKMKSPIDYEEFIGYYYAHKSKDELENSIFSVLFIRDFLRIKYDTDCFSCFYSNHNKEEEIERIQKMYKR